LGHAHRMQTWYVREMIAKDFPGTIKQLADAGFQTVELCSPYGYSDSGFAGLAKYSEPKLRRILADAGVSCYQFSLRNCGPQKRSAARHRLGQG